MTTNAGAGELAKSAIGFTRRKRGRRRDGRDQAHVHAGVPQPAGCDDLVRALDHDVILRVVDKFLLELEAQLHEKKVEPSFTPALKEFLAKKGFDPQMGARPMARLIQDTIRKALADELLFGRLVGGGKVTIDIDDDEKIRLVFEEDARARAESVA